MATPSSRSRRRPSPKSDSTPSRSCFFHWLIWTGWTWKIRDSSARVRVCLAASKATLALKAAGCRFLRVLAMKHLGMQQRTSISLTSRVVQEMGSTSNVFNHDRRFLPYLRDLLFEAFEVEPAVNSHPEQIFQLLKDKPRSLFCFLDSQHIPEIQLQLLRGFTQGNHRVLLCGPINESKTIHAP